MKPYGPVYNGAPFLSVEILNTLKKLLYWYDPHKAVIPQDFITQTLTGQSVIIGD